MSEQNTAIAGVPGSMSGMAKAAIDVWTFREGGTTAGRLMRVEDYGLGRVWVQDIGSPTGFGWWADREAVREASSAR